MSNGLKTRPTSTCDSLLDQVPHLKKLRKRGEKLFITNSRLPIELGEVFGRIRVELLHAGLAAEFDLLAFVGFNGDLAHAAELVPTDDASIERVRRVSGKAGDTEGD